MTLLVTGASGFIGSYLVDALLRASDDTIVSADLRSPLAPAGVLNSKRTQFRKCDISRLEDVKEMAKDAEVVFHLASIRDVPASVRDPISTFEVNVKGTVNVLEACRLNDVRRIVYASAASVYGTPRSIPVSEDHVTEPINPYGASKLAGERYCLAFHHAYGLEVICLRYTNVYGFDPQGGSVVQKFVTQALIQEPIVVYGDGQQKKQFTYVDDVTGANMLALNTNIAKGVFNIAGPSPHTINELVNLIKKEVGNQVVYRPPREGDIVSRELIISTELARERLGFIPKTDLASGVTKLIRDLRQATS